MAEAGDSKPGSVNLFCQCFRSTHTGLHETPGTIHDKRSGQPSVHVANWTHQLDSRSQLKRSNIFHAIVRNQNTEQLRTILGTGWDVNEILEKPGHVNYTTTLHAAARQGWTEGVQLLCAAGAKYMTPGTADAPLQLALQNHGCSVDMVQLLLKHGAGPKLSKKDSPCLGQALLGMSYSDNFTQIVRLLLENGADPNVATQLDSDWINHIQSNMDFRYRTPTKLSPLAVVLILLANPVSSILSEGSDGSSVNADKVKGAIKANAEMFKMLVNFGADVNSEMTGMRSLIHTMNTFLVWNHLLTGYTKIFLPEHLDVFYKNGRDINMVYSNRGTALECTVRNLGHSNSVRWLIRHGAEVHPSMIVALKGHFTLAHRYAILYQQMEGTPLILLQAGMRISPEIHAQLMDIEKDYLYVQEYIHVHGNADDSTVQVRINYLCAKMQNKTFLKFKKFNNCKKHIFLQYLSTQMSDLEEFSDASLLVYPEVDTDMHQTKNKMTFALDQIWKVLEFLSQPQSLQWHCRQCVRENLVSLQPSVVKTLSVPAQLKRYILCHEL